MGGRREPGAIDDAAGRVAIASALEHALLCKEAECRKCREWLKVVKMGGPTLIADGAVIAKQAIFDARVREKAIDVIRAVANARQSPTMSLRRSVVEEALQKLAEVAGEHLPAPAKLSR